MPVVTLYVRRGCHLCEAAEQVAAGVAGRFGAVFERRDIDGPRTDAVLRAHYDTAVPVLHVDGVEVARGRIDEGVVEGQLAIREWAVVVMAKYPVAGRVKTRLTQGEGAVTAEQAARLHELFLRAELGVLTGLNPGRVVLCFDPPGAEGDFRDLVAGWGLMGEVGLMAQSSGDLGERLSSAYERLSDEGAAGVLFFGADTPELTPGLVRGAAVGLRDHAAVLGPSSDGGYWTIGVRAGLPLREILHGIPWSSGRELSATVERLRRRGYPSFLTERLDDVDRPADLVGLANRLGSTGVGEHLALLGRLRLLSLAP